MMKTKYKKKNNEPDQIGCSLSVCINNPHMRQPGWRWKWVGRANLEDRPSLLVTGGVGLCVAKWLGTFPLAGSALAVAASGACPGHRALAQAIGRLPQAASGLAQATPGRTPGIYLRCIDWAHSQSLWPGALPGRTGRTPGIYASYVTERTPSPTLLSSSCMP